MEPLTNKVSKVRKIPGEQEPPQPNLTFVVVSDTHSKHDYLNLPAGDVLLHCGDFTMYSSLDEVKKFSQWISSLPYRYKIVIAGNHEFAFDVKREGDWQGYLAGRKGFPKVGQMIDFAAIRNALTGCIYLEDSGVDIEGYRIYGTPYQAKYSNSAFQRDKFELDTYWKLIPNDTDILMTHSPPYDFCDEGKKGVLCGCPDLRKHVQQRIKPKYHVFGHIHEGAGWAKDANTKYINAAFCAPGYKPINEPFTFKLPARQAPWPADVPLTIFSGKDELKPDKSIDRQVSSQVGS